MAVIAFLGTGLMGAPMAARLGRAGHDVTVWNRTSEKAAPLSSIGVSVATSPERAVVGATTVITMLANSTAVDEVAFGPAGFAGGLAAGTTWIEMSTIGPDHLHVVAQRLPAGARIVDAPVLGSVPQATEGTLEIFVGCDHGLFGVVQPLLAVLGNPTYIGPSGSGAAMKLVVNSALVSLQCILGECLALGDAFGLDQTKVLDALESSSLGPVTSKKRANIEGDDWSPRFTLENGVKDAVLVTQAAHTRGIRLSLAEAARTWFENARATGLGSEDYSAVIKEIRN